MRKGIEDKREIKRYEFRDTTEYEKVELEVKEELE